jgi:hypothetical protein
VVPATTSVALRSGNSQINTPWCCADLLPSAYRASATGKKAAS